MAKRDDARRSSWMALMKFWLDELLELPGNLFAEYWLLVMKSLLKGENIMSSQSAKRISLSVLLPLTLAILLWIINPGYIKLFFASFHGWLVLCSFFLIHILNFLHLNGFSENAGKISGWRSWLPSWHLQFSYLGRLF